MTGINQPTVQPTSLPQIGDRVQYGVDSFGTVVEVYSPTDVLVRSDSGNFLVRVPTYQLTRIQGAPLPPKKSHTVRNIVLAVVGVAVFLLLAAAVIGGEPEPAATTSPVAKAEPKAQPAPEPDPPSVTDLEAALPECDTPWIAGEDAGFDGSQYGAELEACGNFDGSGMAVVDLSTGSFTGDNLNSVLKEQGTFSGSYSLVGPTWLIVAPTRHDVKAAQDSLGGIVDEL